MTKYAAHLTTLKVSGTTTAITDEACTLVTGRTYQLDTAAKRVLDVAYIPSFTVKEGVNTIDAQHLTFDCLFGKVTIAAGYGAIGGAVTMTGKYMPLHEIALCYGFSIDIADEQPDVTAIDAARDAVTRDRMPGLLTASGTLSEFDYGATVYDGAAAILSAILTGGTDFLLDVNLGNSGVYFRAWAKMEGMDINGDVADVLKGTHKWQSINRAITGSATTATAIAAFNFSDT